MGSPGTWIKAITDWVLALAALVIFSPVLLIGMAAVKFSSPGPTFFKQDRVGVNGKVFKIYKLRTMVENAPEVGPEITETRDPRITRVGRLLRKTSIDELPQIWNVLRGEMSVVGPRPEVPSIVDAYTPQLREVLQYKPGITGISQISGRASLSVNEKILMEIEYYRRETFWADLIIVIRTPLVVISGKGNVM